MLDPFKNSKTKTIVIIANCINSQFSNQLNAKNICIINSIKCNSFYQEYNYYLRSKARKVKKQRSRGAEEQRRKTTPLAGGASTKEAREQGSYRATCGRKRVAGRSTALNLIFFVKSKKSKTYIQQVYSRLFPL
ncbi:MAG: hypothetical protein V7K67_10485 [Nostoc sp.]|uniref:hypothetical protein n=1 Tax=Nostoc sp. TaxID=1180 RepID=UPI002FF4474D